MRILIAEDDVVSRKVLSFTLEQWGHELVITNDGRAALAALEEADAPPLAILDVMMPGLDGFEICRRVRAWQQREQVPYIILLTAKTQRNDVVEGLNSGADDYLIKPCDPIELRARVGCGIRIVELQQELREQVRTLKETNQELNEAKAELRNLSLTDDLTNLANRRGFFTFAAKARAAARRNNQRMQLFYFDMDGLKQINDRCGHDEGSRALCSIANCLRRTFRASDTIGRLGGDEFAALASGANEQTETAIIARLRDLLREETIRGQHPHPLSLSVGSVFLDADDKLDIEEHLRLADEAMYQQKKLEKRERQ